MEYPDRVIAELSGKSEEKIKDLRKMYIIYMQRIRQLIRVPLNSGTDTIIPALVLKMRFSKPRKKRVLVLGSGPIRIGQGIEFDYCSVHATWAFRNMAGRQL